MKKTTLIALVAIIILCLSLTGCGTQEEKEEEFVPYTNYTASELDASQFRDNWTFGDYFVTVKGWECKNGFKIVYARDTKVMYLIVDNRSQYAITPLYNADGTLQIYDGE